MGNNIPDRNKGSGYGKEGSKKTLATTRAPPIKQD
jgi:hypothetical protein